MKTIKIVKIGSQFKTSISILVIFILLSACSKKINFATSTIVPAAEGVVKIKKDYNNNRSISIKIKNLAEPERLQITKSVYVVWMVTEESGIKNIGQLTSSKKIFSSLLEGKLKTVTPFTPTRVFITAELISDISIPGSYIILETKTF
ncbi:hypothetical protein [Daejeonella sp.]|jgi:hypothetical protein|uniref:hypothetical protein n=1 Tax=Daejeonella sp. TaxID=2805397 RepID=UPI003784FBB9